MSDWLLFGTDGCHLCEDAQRLAAEAGLNVQVLDIMDRPEWQDRYGLRIPVLAHPDTYRALDWPFSLTELIEFVSDQAAEPTKR